MSSPVRPPLAKQVIRIPSTSRDRRSHVSSAQASARTSPAPPEPQDLVDIIPASSISRRKRRQPRQYPFHTATYSAKAEVKTTLSTSRRKPTIFSLPPTPTELAKERDALRGNEAMAKKDREILAAKLDEHTMSVASRGEAEIWPEQSDPNRNAEFELPLRRIRRSLQMDPERMARLARDPKDIVTVSTPHTAIQNRRSFFRTF